MIPFYTQRVQYIQNEIAEKKRLLAPQNEIQFLTNTLVEVERKLENEKKEVQDLANALYDNWIAISDLREEQKFASTNVHLKVH